MTSHQGSLEKYAEVGGGWVCTISVTNCYGKCRRMGVSYFCYATPKIKCNGSTFSLSDECFQKCSYKQTV